MNYPSAIFDMTKWYVVSPYPLSYVYIKNSTRAVCAARRGRSGRDARNW